MSFTVRPIHAHRTDFGAYVDNIDLARLLSPQDFERIEEAIARYGVLVFRDQRISNEEQIAWTAQFGEIEGTYSNPGDNSQVGRIPSVINDVSNLDRDNRVLAANDRHRLFQLGNLLWHSDSSYKEAPARYSLLLARAIPDSGGNTEFADMRAAWDTLDAAMQARLRNLVCEHSRLFSRAEIGFTFTEEERRKFAPVRQRLVRRHPRSGRLSLFLSSHAGAIEGMELPEARALLRDLTEHATQRERVYAHEWAVNDLVMWDNRVTMHRGRRFPEDQARDLRRTTTSDALSTLLQAA